MITYEKQNVWSVMISGIVLVISFLICGCATGQVASFHDSIEITPIAQWRECAGSNIHVAEILFPSSQVKGFFPTVQIEDIQLNTSSGTNLQSILWWRFSDVVGVPQAKMLTIAFSDSPKTPVALTIQNGTQSEEIILPKYNYPAKRIEAISKLNDKEIAIKVASECAKPKKIFVNGIFRPFQMFSDETDFLVIRHTLCNTDVNPLLLEVCFSDGERRFSYVYLPSKFQITLDGADEAICRKLSIDSSSICKPLKSEDVCCIDDDSKKAGYAIPIILKELIQSNVSPNSLHFCSTATSFSFDVYSPIADFATSSNLSFLKKKQIK